MNLSMQMIWIRIPAQKQKCKGPLIKSLSHVITICSQSQHKKTDVVHQPVPEKKNICNIMVSEQKLKVVDKLNLLNSPT